MWLWTTTEWLIRCPGVYYLEHDSGPKGGPLCPDIKGYSRERWDFWKKRLVEIKGSDLVKQDDAEILERIDRALAAMEAVESQGKMTDKPNNKKSDKKRWSWIRGRSQGK